MRPGASWRARGRAAAAVEFEHVAQALALAQGRARRLRRRPVADEELVEDLVGARGRPGA
ncbi:hypothetical protein OWM54_43130 [Myxococcus sp. MISCRS1]|uniref:hypothetical protein n=1 Tax=Myxococcus sp. MISCRS1 TaxID=2996786 RepID=UPI002271AE32|nr:hypothetical protein [Myxococcus sp. MISCRS1]MCY1003960.1 hypothetical protein [Myxococcus sp. MISCRS1]